MAVSKRLRYEILRRDKHACRYCGATAPDVPLRVDHVIPVALGGSDAPENLVAACEPCNSGKTSTIEGRVPAARIYQVPESPEALVSEAEGLWVAAFTSIYSGRELLLGQLEEVRAGVLDMRRLGISDELIKRSATVAGLRGDTFICLVETSDLETLAVTSEAFRLWRSIWHRTTGYTTWPDMQEILLFECSVEQAVNAGLDRFTILRASALTGHAQGVYIEDHLDPAVRSERGL
ncbi:HNH endonuclease [Streptomyces globisporus]